MLNTAYIIEPEREKSSYWYVCLTTHPRSLSSLYFPHERTLHLGYLKCASEDFWLDRMNA